MAPRQEEAEANSVRRPKMQQNTAPEVIVYGSDACTDCARTAMFLRSKRIDYKYVDVMSDEAAYALVKSKGSTMPVVTSPIGDWIGLRPDRIVALAKHYAEDPADDGPDTSVDIEPGPSIAVIEVAQ